MGFLDLFKQKRVVQKYGTWRELGKYTSQFNAFGSDIYQSEIVRACIRPLAEHSSKAFATSSHEYVAKILNESPNMYMNGKDFLAKVRTKLEIQNTAFIFIARDDKGHASSFYPVPYTRFEALEYNNGLFIRFYFDKSGAQPLVMPWNDLAVLRKDYNESDIAGDDNRAILGMLELISTSEQGVANAVKATANLRGILKSTKAMLASEDIRKAKDEFVRDYLNLENSGGIASLDSTQEFTPIEMKPALAGFETLREFRENVQRYFGVSNSIIMSDFTEAQMDAFYDSKIETFLVALSVELTRKVFTERERGFGAHITYESNRIQFTSTNTKLAMVALVDRGALTPNEWRRMFNLKPVDGGDVPIRRLDTDTVDIAPVNTEEGDEDGEDK